METTRRMLPPNPREKANFLSILLFTWTIPLFKKGYAKILHLEDIFEPLICDRSETLGDRLDSEWKKQLLNTQPSLIKAVFQTFWKEYTLFSLICFLTNVILRLGQPLLLGKLLLYFGKDSTMSFENALYYASAIVALNGVYGIMINQVYVRGFHNGMKVRVAVCSIIYRKALRLSQTALGETAPGKLVNLLSNDVNRFDWASLLFNGIWMAPLLTIVIGYFLWKEAGGAGMIGIAVVFIDVPIQSYAGKLLLKFRLETAVRTDERVRFMDEIISGVQVIKMYAWEKPFTQLIAYARQMELKIVRKTSYVRALYMTFMLFTTRMAIFSTMLATALLYGSNQITSDKVFVISAYFAIISHVMSEMFVCGVAEMAEAWVAIKRLQHFLEYEEKGPEGVKHNINGYIADNDEKQNHSEIENSETEALRNISVSINHANARWIIASSERKTQQKSNSNISTESDTHDWKASTLRNLNVELPQAKLIGIVGPVGAGKSSFLQVLLRELPLESGSICINGTISYACQEPWVFAGSIRQNILFGQDYDRERYDAIIKICALATDFEELENGDRTIIGERGASLSGGQKARINLARAAYRKADIYLLDDPLSAVDAHVSQHLFNQCIGPNGYLAQQRSTRILVTHQVQFLKHADWILVLRDGKIEMQGSPMDLPRSVIDFSNQIGAKEKQENGPNSEKLNRRIPKRLSTRSASSLSLCHLNENSVDKIEENDNENTTTEMEASSKGKVKGSIAGNYFAAGGQLATLGGMLILLLFVQLLASGADFWVAVWTKQEENRAFNPNKNHGAKITSFNETTKEVQNIFSTNADENQLYSFSTKFCMYVHGGLLLALFIFTIIRSVGFYAICLRASQKLHDFMFVGLISTTMRFFDTNPSGRILNRFSKDMGATDDFLPKALLDAAQVILMVFGSIIVTTIINPLLLIPIAVIAILTVLIRKIYLKTSKDIKRLEAVSKSPVFTHLSATIHGLSTIRAFRAEKMLKNEFDYHQDTHSACWFLFISTSSAFGLSLDLMCFIFLFCVIFFFMNFDTGISGDKVGLAITQAMSLTGILQYGIRQSAEVTNHLTSVERVLEYRDLTPEKQPQNPHVIAKQWPSKGQIEFRNVCYRYFVQAAPVLRNLTFVVKPMEKIGIVGRTGAGKSSLIGAIFRLACADGEILIDGIETSSLLLNDLRSRIVIIPQDPVLFSGTLRRNLDPFDEYTDSDVWSALDKVKLKEIASGPLGLQSVVMAHGSNFSVGQRQLICLARAILRNSRILVLDEATANVDPQTDLLIQRTIKQTFAACTVLTVAHRLHTIIDSDRVLVINTGKAVEFDEPHNLLQYEAGIFKEMVKALGPQEFMCLSQIAHDKYDSKRKNM